MSATATAPSCRYSITEPTCVSQLPAQSAPRALADVLATTSSTYKASQGLSSSSTIRTTMSPVSESAPKLFQPITIGDITLGHRIAMAPMTRCRASEAGVPGSLTVEYYAQRASTPGTLIIAEGTFISPRSSGFNYVPGIWSPEQVEGWKKVVDAVHAEGSFIYLQLYSAGRQADPSVLERQGMRAAFAAASPIAFSTQPDPLPRELTIHEIKMLVEETAVAAKNAVHGAGFDGVEVHCANGYLLDQFLQDTANKRTDEYGGSVENRSRFPLESIKAVVEAVGAKKTAVRISPWGTFGDMRMADPRPTFTYFVKRLRDLWPDLAYLSVVEPRVSGAVDVEKVDESDSNDFVRELWAPRPLISAGGYTRTSALEAAEKAGLVVAFGRTFLANPDLPFRIMKNIPFAPHHRSTFYSRGAEGYTDYPFADVRAW
ncbi:FMN-linked oxidoreductase [Heliocybe sulcata]|uniref:FMN-linked oxidoreductase n=1 Tax=Heliocybe sulcata TaxID=5364 RepID=A0A5C3N924_9AGAM|nr:FMN-linked oxidoreductase [Heliocybe sulcata]